MNKMINTMMKPINPDYEKNNNRFAALEEMTLSILEKSNYSMTAAEIGKVLGEKTAPGYNPGEYRTREESLKTYNICFASRILRRLESKGEIISTLYRGKRLYSILVGDDNN